MNGLARAIGQKDVPSHTGYTVTSGALDLELSVEESRALDVADSAIDPREIDTLRLEETVSRFLGPPPVPYLTPPVDRIGTEDALRGRLCGLVEKLEGKLSPPLVELRAELVDILDAHRSIARARFGGRP